MCPIPIHEEALFIAPHPSTDSVVHHAPTPSVVVVEEDRCRSRSCSSLGLTPRYVFPSPHRTQNCRNRSRSPSLSPRWTRPRPRNFSPARRTPMINVPLPSPSPMPIAQPGPSPVVLPPSWYAEPPSGVWPTQVPKQPADILTLNYNNNFAYAPAAKTYDVRPPHPFFFFLMCLCVCACVRVYCDLTEGTCPFTGGNRYCVGALARVTRRPA